MNALRALPLLILFTGQVLAGGWNGGQHLCPARTSTHACPCAHPRASATADTLRKPDCCRNLDRSELPDGRTESARTAQPRVDAPQLVLAILTPAFETAMQPPRERAPQRVGLEHGPPKYLALRTLLI
jgi:hypothetical protein